MTVARPILAALLLAMATGQLLDSAGFFDILETYDAGPDPLALILGVVLIVGEVVGGVSLLTRFDVGPPVALAVAVLWTVLGAQAFARGLVVPNCGCFGVYLGQPLRWWVLVQDAEFVALAWWVRRRWRHRPADEDAPTQYHGVQYG